MKMTSEGYHGDTSRCCGTTSDGQRCKRDATTQIGNKPMCFVHARKHTEAKLKPRLTTRPSAE